MLAEPLDGILDKIYRNKSEFSFSFFVHDKTESKFTGASGDMPLMYQVEYWLPPKSTLPCIPEPLNPTVGASSHQKAELCKNKATHLFICFQLY
jgi:hypothetical protein